MILTEEVISKSVEKCEKDGIIALYIPERIIGKGFWIKVRDFERSFYDATCIDSARFIKREEFLKVGGFDEALTGPEDWDLDRRIKEAGKVGIVDVPLYHNEGRLYLRNYLNKKKYYSKDFNSYIKKWGNGDSLIRKQLGLRYRFFEVFLENGKWLKLACHPILTIGMYFLRFLLGLNYLLTNSLVKGS